MNTHDQERFNTLYQTYLNELTLQGKSPKTIECYSRCLRQTEAFFDTCPDHLHLSVEDLKGYFLYLVEHKSWSLVKITPYIQLKSTIQFFYKQVLHHPWQWVDIVKPPKIQPI